MLHVSINLMCMQLHRLHKWPTYAHHVFTKHLNEVQCVVHMHNCCHGNIHYTYHIILSELFMLLVVLHVRSNLTLL